MSFLVGIAKKGLIDYFVQQLSAIRRASIFDARAPAAERGTSAHPPTLPVVPIEDSREFVSLFQQSETHIYRSLECSGGRDRIVGKR